MKFLVCSRLSEHRYKTPEGYLVCVDSILSRTGKQTYSRDELFKDGRTDEVEVERSAEEVFSEKTLASFENKPLTIEHPEEDVTPANHNKYSVGFIRDVKRGKDGSEDVMLGTIVVTDAEAIELIETGKLKELSCGYDCDIEDEDNPQQRNIRGNHVALCEHGRAGIARIVDSKCKDDQRLPAKIKNELKRILHAKSTFIRNKDYDVSEFVRDVERWFKIDGTPIKLVRESINGWNKMADGMMRKDYIFSVEGYADRFMLSVYADPNTWHTTELNGYFLDSVKDAEQLYAVEFSYDGDSRSDYLGHVNVRAKSEQDALTKAKRWAVEHYDNPGFFKIASTKYTNVETIDVIKDAMFEICYIDNGDVCVAIEAKDENDARQKFHRRYGMYYIRHIRKIKDGVKDMTNICDRLIEIPEDRLRRFEEQLKMRKIHVVSRGRTMMGRIHYQVEFGGPARQLAKLLNELDGIMDRQNIPMTYSVGGNDDDYSTAGIDLDKMYVKDCKDEDPYEESTKGLEEAEKNLHDKMICNSVKKKDSVKKLDYKKLLSIVRAAKSIKK